MKENFIFTETLRTLIEEKKYQSLRDVLLTAQPVDLAAALAEMPPQDLSLLFRLLPKDEAADTFVEMDADSREELIRGFSDSELRDILNELYLDDTVDLIEEVPALLVGRILEQSSPESRRLINELLRYPDDSAGSIMTTEYVGLHAAMTVGEAIEHIRRVGIDSENINVCYVTDRGRRLIGIVTIRTLILAEPGASVGSVMNENIISVRTLDDKEDVANVFTKYGSIVLPVVDSEERLVGIVTVDDVMNVIRDEATEDIDKIGAVTPSDKPYMKLSVLEIFKNRIPWLLVLTVSAAFTGSIITHFQDALSSYLVLVAAIPMLMDTGGNCGSQPVVGHGDTWDIPRRDRIRRYLPCYVEGGTRVRALRRNACGAELCKAHAHKPRRLRRGSGDLPDAHRHGLCRQARRLHAAADSKKSGT